MGTLDLCPCCAIGHVHKREDDVVQVEHVGENKMYWNNQYQAKTLLGELLYQCERGKEWPESDLIWSTEDAKQLVPETDQSDVTHD